MTARKSLPATTSTPTTSSRPSKPLATSTSRKRINSYADDLLDPTPSRPRRKAARLETDSIGAVDSAEPAAATNGPESAAMVGVAASAGFIDAAAMDAEKELEVWQDFAAEHYEMVEQLPLELHRNFRLLRELDDGCLGQQEKLLLSIRQYIDLRIGPNVAPDSRPIVPIEPETSTSGASGQTEQHTVEPTKDARAGDDKAVETSAVDGPTESSSDTVEKKASGVPEIVMDGSAVDEDADQHRSYPRASEEAGPSDPADPVSAEDAVEAVLDVVPTPRPVLSDDGLAEAGVDASLPHELGESGEEVEAKEGEKDDTEVEKDKKEEVGVPVPDGQGGLVVLPPAATAREGESTVPASHIPFPPKSENAQLRAPERQTDGDLVREKDDPERKKRLALLPEISKISREFVRNSEEKLAIAVGAYNSIDRHIRALDAALAAQDASLVLGLRPSTLPSTKVNESLNPSDHAGVSGSGMGAGMGADETGEDIVIGMTGTGGRKRDRKKKKGKVVALEPEIVDPAFEYELDADPNEPRYCYCNQVSYGEMVGCDNDDCPIEWFHLGCIGLASAPTGSWYCDECRPAMGLALSGAAASTAHGHGGEKKKNKSAPKRRR